MIELLWGEQPPATAATALHGHISSLRKALGPDVISGKVLRSIRAGNAPVAITVGAGAVRVANDGDDSVSRIDPRTSSVTKAIAVGEQPAAVAAAGGSVWVANSGDGSVSRIDAHTNHVIDTFSVGHSPKGVAVAGASDGESRTRTGRAGAGSR